MRRIQFLPKSMLNWGLLFTLLSPSVAGAQPQAFLPAQAPTAVRRYHAAPVEGLFPRQTTTGGCIAGTYSCSDQGSAFSGICCANGQSCSLDAQNSPACCPNGDVCTGTAPSSYHPPSTTSASFVANPYFSFPYIVTSFPNAGACSRAVSQCSANYAACTADLEGGGGGVTVVVGGSTMISGTPSSTFPTNTATSVCSSLSSVACFGIQGSVCTAGSTGGFSVGNANAAARATGVPCVGIVAGVAAGVGFGMMGI